MNSNKWGLSSNIIITLLIISGLQGFTLPFTIIAQSQNDGNSGEDASSDINLAPSIEFDKTYSGMIGNSLSDAEGNEDINDIFILPKIEDEKGILQIDFFVKTLIGWSITQLITVYPYYVNPTTGEKLADYNNIQSAITYNFDNTGNSADEIWGTLNVPVQNYQYMYIDFYNRIKFVFLEYEFTVTYATTDIDLSQNDAGSSIDAPGQSDPLDYRDGLNVNMDILYYATIGNGYLNKNNLIDLYDAFKIDVEQDGYLTIDLEISSSDRVEGHIYLQSFDTGGTLKLYEFVSSQIDTVVAAGSYILMFDGFRADSVIYNFQLSFTEEEFPQQNDGNSNHDAESVYYPDGKENQIVATFNSSISGTIGTTAYSISNDDVDNTDVYALPNLSLDFIKLTISMTSWIDFSQIELLLINDGSWLDNYHLSLIVDSATQTASAEIRINYTEYGYTDYYISIYYYDSGNDQGNSLIEYQVDIEHFGESENPFEPGPTSIDPTNQSITNDTEVPIKELYIDFKQIITIVGIVLIIPTLYLVYRSRKVNSQF